MRLIDGALGLMEEISPLGLVMVGGTLALTLAPTAKKSLRRAAVLTTRGVLAASEAVSGVAITAYQKVNHEVTDIVEEAKKERKKTQEPTVMAEAADETGPVKSWDSEAKTPTKNKTRARPKKTPLNRSKTVPVI